MNPGTSFDFKIQHQGGAVRVHFPSFQRENVPMVDYGRFAVYLQHIAGTESWPKNDSDHNLYLACRPVARTFAFSSQISKNEVITPESAIPVVGNAGAQNYQGGEIIALTSGAFYLGGVNRRGGFSDNDVNPYFAGCQQFGIEIRSAFSSSDTPATLPSASAIAAAASHPTIHLEARITFF